MEQFLEGKPLEEVKEETLAFTEKMRILMRTLHKEDFYTFFYLNCIEAFDPKVPVVAMSYTKTIYYLALPRIVYGPELIPFIEKILEKAPNIANRFIKEVKWVTIISKENEEVLKRFFIFREIVKHEILHYVNLHLPRIVEFFKKRGISKISRPLLIKANAAADSICNIYLDKKVIEQGGFVPPLEKEIPLEELLEKIDPNGNQFPVNGSNGSGDSGKGFEDFLSDEAEDLEKRDFSGIKEVVGRILEKAIEEYKRNPKGIGKIPSEIEETIKWLKKREE
jgi:hypothetical protein